MMIELYRVKFVSNNEKKKFFFVSQAHVMVTLCRRQLGVAYTALDLSAGRAFEFYSAFEKQKFSKSNPKSRDKRE